MDFRFLLLALGLEVVYILYIFYIYHLYYLFTYDIINKRYTKKKYILSVGIKF